MQKKQIIFTLSNNWTQLENMHFQENNLNIYCIKITN